MQRQHSFLELLSILYEMNKVRFTKLPFLSREGFHFCFPSVGNICVFQFYVLRLRFYTLICIAPVEELGLM